MLGLYQMWSHMEPAVSQSYEEEEEEKGKACDFFINISDGNSIPYSSYINQLQYHALKLKR